jgi:hypothetical protein
LCLQEFEQAIDLTVFLFFSFFLKILSNVPLGECLKKIDPRFGAVTIDAKVTRHGASAIGAKVLAPMQAWS